MTAKRGLRLLLCGSLCSIALLSCLATGALASTITAIDRFVIVRNGMSFFDDAFSDGLVPPSAPNFSGGTPASYSVGGTLPTTAETGGKLSLDSSLGQLFVNAAGVNRLSQSATLLTNLDPLNTTAGLKINHTFVIGGLFDLTAPADLLGNYGIVVLDRAPALGIPGDEQLQIQVIRRPGDQIKVEFFRQDFLTNTVSVIGEQLVDFGLGDQILLSLEHATANSSDFLGSLQYFDDGLPVGSAIGLGTSTMFRGEDFVRATFFAAEQIVPEPSALVLLVAGLAGAAWIRRRRLIQK